MRLKHEDGTDDIVHFGRLTNMEPESFHPEKEEENDLPIMCRFYVNLAGGFKYFYFIPTWGNDPI